MTPNSKPLYLPFSNSFMKNILYILLFALVITGCKKAEEKESRSLRFKPPIAQKIAKTDTFHGEVVTDNYFWLRGKEKPEVISYLEAENVYTDSMTVQTKSDQELLFNEIKGRIKENDLSVPVKNEDYFYYTRTEEGKQYTIYCRKKGSMDAKEEILLDVNKLAEGQKYMRVGAYQVSPDHKILAYSTDNTGGEQYTLQFKNLETGEMLKDQVTNTYYAVTWANDNKTIFYNVLNDARRPFKIFRHKLGTDASADPLVYHEKDEKFSAYISKTNSKKYLTIDLGSTLTSEVLILEADKPEGKFRVFQSREQGLEYDVDHHNEHFYMVTNKDGAKNFKLMRTKIAETSKEKWSDVYPYDAKVNVQSAIPFVNHIAVMERANGLRRLKILNMKDNTDHYVEFPESAYTISGSSNPNFNTTKFRYNYTSLVRPLSVFEYDMDSRKSELLKQNEVVGGYDVNAYQSERVMVKANDGVMVPMSIVYKKGFNRTGSNPCYLYAYGSYGSSMDPNFSPTRLSLLDRGFVYAIAHIRGGGEFGEEWHDDGKFLKKKNTFTDFINCAEYLVNEKYTAKDKLVVGGGSAGGLLMGAVTNMRPDLFRIVVAKVPFVDVMNTMSDPTLPLTVGEYEEWGNPADREYYEYMKSYSPYENVTKKNYPNILVTAGLNDPRVSYWEPAKWVAKLRENNTSENTILLKTNMGAGHGGASGRYDALKETAFEYAFIFDILGVEVKQKDRTSL
jgi:oligopeptidase B